MKRILFFILCIMPLAIMAQPGTLDKTFGDDGISFNVNIVGVINKVGLQSDGKIIAAGSGGKDISSAFLFERYNTDGSIDSSFGTDGHAGNLNELDQVFALAIQPDDGFIAMGHPSYKVGLARYKKDGELDSSFGVNGIVITSVSPNANSASDMLVQPDGKIVVCGYIINAPNEARQLFLVRYLPNGSLDNSFGDGGIVIVGEPNSDYALYSVNAIALQPNGQIVVAAYLTKGAAYRFNTDGTLDTDFGNNGLAYFQSANAALRGFIPNDVVIQTDGKIVSGGNGIKKGLTPDYYMAAACIDTDGGIDSSFGDNGIQHILFSGQTSDCRSMALQNNGKIILAGRALGKMAMARLNADGSIDSSFGESGQIVTTEAEGSGASNSVVLQNDNKILLGGYTYVDGLPPLGYFLLARYNNGLTKKQIIFAKIRRWWQHHNGIMWNNVPGIKNYAIQRSGDGAHWSTVYSASINHSPLSGNNYYNDPSPLPGTNYYCLQTTSVTGAVNYSNVIAINNTAIKISPNPAKNVLHIEGLPKDKKVKLSVVDLAGMVKIQTIANSVPLYNINIASLHPGNYLLKIESSGDVVTKKFVKE